MYKTEWALKSELGYTAKIICYHFRKHPRFAPYLLTENESYEIEMVWNSKLINTPVIFLKCLFHKNTVIIKEN